MAARNWAPLQALGRQYKVIAGSFAPNNTSAVSASSNKGPGWSVARTAAGKFTITLTDKYNDLVSATATVQATSDTVDLYPQFGDYSASSKTLVLKLKTGTANTDIAADANNRVHFVLVLSNTGMVPARG